jgi:hypothetical protein
LIHISVTHQQIIDSTTLADKNSRRWSVGSAVLGCVPGVQLVYYCVFKGNASVRNPWDVILLFCVSAMMAVSFYAVSKTVHTKLLLLSKSFCESHKFQEVSVFAV